MQKEMENVEWCNECTILTPNPLIDFRLGIPQVKVRLGSCYCGMAPVDWRRATEVVALRDARAHHVRGHHVRGLMNVGKACLSQLDWLQQLFRTRSVSFGPLAGLSSGFDGE